MADAIALVSPSSSENVQALLLDIEGTTTSISFVKDKLFPYTVDNVEKFLTSSWEDESVQAAVDGMRQQSAKDVEGKIDGAISIADKNASKEDQIDSIAKNLKWLISIDNKSTHMKDLSGLIWQKGYEDGEIKGHLYDDVKPAIEKWKEVGKKVYIYSSGSVKAQKLLMKYSTAGDLEPLIDGYFDTNVGHKRDVESYKNILGKIECPSENILFLTDIVEEGNAAKEAGINVMLLSREGNAAFSGETKEKYTIIETFADVKLTSLKRKSSPVEEETRPAKILKNELNGTVNSTNGDVEEKVVETIEKAVEATETTVETTTEVETPAIVETPVAKETPAVETPAPIQEEQMEVDVVIPKVSEDKIEVKLDTNGDKVENVEEETKTDKVEEKENEIISDKEVKNEVKGSEEDAKMDKTEEIRNTSDKAIEPEPMETDVSDLVTEQNGAVDNVAVAEEEKTEIEVEKNESVTVETNNKAENVVVEKVEEVKDVDKVLNGDYKKDSAELVEEKKEDKIDDDKLIELIQEETVELDKECEKIISKAKNVIDNTKDLINKSAEEKMESEVDDKPTENGQIKTTDVETTEDLKKCNNEIEKVSETTVVEEVVKDDVKPASQTETEEKVNEQEPVNEKESEKVAECKDLKNGTTKDVNGEEAVNGHNMNGKEVESGVNGNSVEGNGDHKLDAETKNTNGTTTTVVETESNGDQCEIKVKKIVTEETPPSENSEQDVKT